MNRYTAVAVCYAILLAAGLGLGAFAHHKRSQVSFGVKIPAGSVVKVYADKGGDGPFQYDPSKPLFSLNTSGKIKTKVGVYDFVIDNGSDYKTSVRKVTVNKATDSVSIEPDLSEARLASELAKDRGAIIAAVHERFAGLDAYYGVSDVGLYKHGEWAGAVLTPRGDYDPVRLVLEGRGSNWKVVNEPSVFVLGSLYKNVPADVVSSINSR